MARVTKAERAEAIARLRELLKDGDEVFCLTTQVSRSGMSRTVKLMTIRPGPVGRADIRVLAWNAAKILGWRFSTANDGIIVQGCGMDMHFHTVDSLGQAIGRKLLHRTI